MSQQSTNFQPGESDLEFARFFSASVVARLIQEHLDFYSLEDRMTLRTLRYSDPVENVFPVFLPYLAEISD
jgi:hypothetical protein